MRTQVQVQMFGRSLINTRQYQSIFLLLLFFFFLSLISPFYSLPFRWTTSIICKQTKQTERLKTVTSLLKLLRRFYKLNNFGASVAMISSLNSSVVQLENSLKHVFLFLIFCELFQETHPIVFCLSLSLFPLSFLSLSSLFPLSFSSPAERPKFKERFRTNQIKIVAKKVIQIHKRTISALCSILTFYRKLFDEFGRDTWGRRGVWRGDH